MIFNMKRTILSIYLSVAAMMLFASDGYQVKYTQPKAGVHQLQFTLGDYSVTDVSLQGQD